MQYHLMQAMPVVESGIILGIAATLADSFQSLFLFWKIATKGTAVAKVYGARAA